MTEVPARRKPHSKSRRGCLSCKKRHTKCNEAHPRCANCIRLKITCTWPSSSRNGSPTSHSNGSEYDIPTHLHHPLGGSNASPTSTLAIDDLRLLHHWTTKVAFFHCSPSESVVPLWSLDAIEIAFEHPFVLHGILAFSAIHKTIHEPLVDRTLLITQADAHISSALTVYMRLLHQSNMENALPMFFMSAILFAYNLASAQIDEPQDPIGDFLHCLRLLRGVREVVGRYWHELAKSSIVHEMLSGVTNIEGIQVSNDVNGEYGSLVSLGEFAAKIDGEEGQVLVDTIGHLHRTFLKALVCRDEKHEHSIFMTWPARLSDEFLNLVEARNPIANIIVAYFVVAMRNWTYAWWTTGWPERVLNATVKLLEPMPELKKWLEWPTQKIIPST